ARGGSQNREGGIEFGKRLFRPTASHQPKSYKSSCQRSFEMLLTERCSAHSDQPPRDRNRGVNPSRVVLCQNKTRGDEEIIARAGIPILDRERHRVVGRRCIGPTLQIVQYSSEAAQSHDRGTRRSRKAQYLIDFKRDADQPFGFERSSLRL